MNPRSLNVVLDKSYLEWVSHNKIQELCIDHKAIMTWATFYELWTTEKKEDRARCFGKFPQRTNPLSLCPNVGYLIGREIAEGRRFSSFEESLHKINFEFNKGLVDASFEMGEDQQDFLNKLKENTDEDVRNFLVRIPGVIEWLPELKEIKAGCRFDEIKPSVDKICKSEGKVREIYSQIRGDNFPLPETIDSHWFLYRWVQVQALAGIYYIWRYGISKNQISRENAEHIYWDVEICAIASMAGALATHDDKHQVWFFRQMCPEGIVIQDK